MRKIAITIIALFMLLMACAGCENPNNGETQADNPSTYPSPSPSTSAAQSMEPLLAEYIKITPEDALGMESVYLDVRTQEEYDDGHIPDAILLHIDDIYYAKQTLPDKDQVIVVYCRTGARSELAARILIDLGYMKVFDLGGIGDWTGEIVDADGRISYNFFGALPDDRVAPFSFSTEKCVAPENGLRFRFTLEGNRVEVYRMSYNNPSRYEVRNAEICISAITIENLDTGSLQELTGFETSNHYANADNMYGLSFDDWNFDGYMDF